MKVSTADNIVQILQFEQYVDDFIDGFLTTMGLYLFALIIGLFLGLSLAIVRQYGGGISSRIATGYVEVIRGTPLLSQVFVIAFAPGAINALIQSLGYEEWDFLWQIRVPDPWGGTSIFLSTRILLAAIALALNSAAYQAEYFRGSISSISGGQLQAARALGMTRTQSIRHIILPQSLRRVIPAWSNEAAYLPKYTTVVSFVAVEELFSISSWVVGRTFLVLQVYVIVAIIFLVLISTVSILLDRLYDKFKIPGM